MMNEMLILLIVALVVNFGLFLLWAFSSADNERLMESYREVVDKNLQQRGEILQLKRNVSMAVSALSEDYCE